MHSYCAHCTAFRSCRTGLRFNGLVLNNIKADLSQSPPSFVHHLHYQWALKGPSKAFICHIPRLIDLVPAAGLQTAIILSSRRILVNHSYRSAFPGVSNPYELTKYLLVILD